MSALIVTHQAQGEKPARQSWVEFQGCTDMLASRRTRSMVSLMLPFSPGAVLAMIKARLSRKS